MFAFGHANVSLDIMCVSKGGYMQMAITITTDKIYNALIENQQIGEIRHIGLINAMELVNNKDTKEAHDFKLRIAYEVYKKALNKGLILRPLGNVLYFNLLLIIKEEERDKSVSICKEAIEKVIFSEF